MEWASQLYLRHRGDSKEPYSLISKYLTLLKYFWINCITSEIALNNIIHEVGKVVDRRENRDTLTIWELGDRYK